MTIQELYDYAKIHRAENIDIKLGDGQDTMTLTFFLTNVISMRVERNENGHLTGGTSRIYLKERYR